MGLLVNDCTKYKEKLAYKTFWSVESGTTGKTQPIKILIRSWRCQTRKPRHCVLVYVLNKKKGLSVLKAIKSGAESAIVVLRGSEKKVVEHQITRSSSKHIQI